MFTRQPNLESLPAACGCMNDSDQARRPPSITRNCFITMMAGRLMGWTPSIRGRFPMARQSAWESPKNWPCSVFHCRHPRVPKLEQKWMLGFAKADCYRKPKKSSAQSLN